MVSVHSHKTVVTAVEETFYSETRKFLFQAVLDYEGFETIFGWDARVLSSKGVECYKEDVDVIRKRSSRFSGINSW